MLQEIFFVWINNDLKYDKAQLKYILKKYNVFRIEEHIEKMYDKACKNRKNEVIVKNIGKERKNRQKT